jgi:hypothetical protein
MPWGDILSQYKKLLLELEFYGEAFASSELWLA